jgi:hypothetical protein
MKHGLDSCLLVAYEATQHPQHTASEALVRRRLSIGDDFALAPQVLAELVHILTDPRRFTQPLTMDAALRRAEMWWTASQVTQVFPTDTAMHTFIGWMNAHRLVRSESNFGHVAGCYLSNRRDHFVNDHQQSGFPRFWCL